jgi:tetratricopeptide (TPR) repeat protein
MLFDRILTTKNKYLSNEIKDLSILAKARLFVLLKRHDEALVEYQSINELSPYYLDSLKETQWIFFHKKEYGNALVHLEALAFVNKRLYFPDKEIYMDERDTLSNLDLMRLKSVQGYIYMEQDRFKEAIMIFNEIILHYNEIKKKFLDDLKKFRLSKDLTQIISHPTPEGLPRSLQTNFNYSFFLSNELYAMAFREWLSVGEKNEIRRLFNLYFSLMKEADRLRKKAARTKLKDPERRVIALRNVMNTYLSQYVRVLIRNIHHRLDDIGLKAQLGRIDIIWKTKENQSENITGIHEKKQEYIRKVEEKYRNLVE